MRVPVEVIWPTLPYLWFTTPLCLLIAFNLFAHYYFVCTIPPGFVEDPPREIGTGFFWSVQKQERKQGGGLRDSGVRWSENLNITPASTSKCRKCGQDRPERSHHCKICDHCVLKFDHHCPWINQCVGIHNERHFVLFMIYLFISTVFFVYNGFPLLSDALGLSDTSWDHYTHEIVFITEFALSSVLGFAVLIMFGWHLWSIAQGETSVEAQDNDQYRKIAKSRGREFVNSYDLGVKKNLALFFNIGEDRYPWYTLVFPFRIPPYTDGYHWARRQGHVSHGGIEEGEELTDTDDD